MGFSINNIVTNEDLVITYTPTSYVTGYSYVIIKDEITLETIFVNGNTPVNINLKEEGNYKINVNINGVVEIGEYVIDKTPPIINIENKTIIIKQNEEFISNVTASDLKDGDLTGIITSNIETLDFSTEGIKKIEYTVSDNAGNISTDIMYVTVKKDNTNLIVAGQILIILLILLIFIFLYKYIKSIILEKRFAKYAINSSKNKSISLLDNLHNQYNEFINKISKKISEVNILKRASNKYSKYIIPFNLDNDPMNVISNKIVIGILFIFGVVIINLFRSKIVEIYEIFIPFILGYYTIDIIYIYKYHLYKKQIEKDLVDAITIMNNSFKAGRSIVQAIDLVATELKGPISLEFKKISMEISLGLEIEVAFSRFAKRIKLEEAIYLTSSLSILNKTGGNIVKVFDSIEKTLFSKRKLREELNSLTSSSKMISYILMFVPIVFLIFLNIINPGFFVPLVTNEIGLILLFIMIIIYIAYILIVKRVMKVRM